MQALRLISYSFLVSSFVFIFNGFNGKKQLPGLFNHKTGISGDSVQWQEGFA